MAAISQVMNTPELFKLVKAYLNPVYEDIFLTVLSDVCYSELYDDGEYISSSMFVDELLEELKMGKTDVKITHGYMYHYGGEGSAWGNAYDKLNEAREKTDKKIFTINCFTRDEPFDWTPALGIKWMYKYFYHYCEMINESNSSESDEFTEPNYWGNLTIQISVKTEAERRDAICWLEEYQKVGNEFQAKHGM